MFEKLIGFDFDTIIPKYPPYNLKKVGENEYELEIAVAGFNKSQLNVTLEDKKLIVSGISKEDKSNYLHKGLAARSFKHEWVIADNVEIKSANLVNGILRVALENIIKAHNLLKIEIKDDEA